MHKCHTFLTSLALFVYRLRNMYGTANSLTLATLIFCIQIFALDILIFLLGVGYLHVTPMASFFAAYLGCVVYDCFCIGNLFMNRIIEADL